MDYNKYYVYKEMVTYDSGQSWEYTGNETPSGDPIGTYDTLEECETSTGHTPTGYDCKFYYEFYAEGISATTSYTIPCNDSTTLTYTEVNDALGDIASQHYGVMYPTLVVVGDCVERIDFTDVSYKKGCITGDYELIISPTVTEVRNLVVTRISSANMGSLFGSIGRLTLYNTIRKFSGCEIWVKDELHLEKGFLDNDRVSLWRNSIFGLDGGYYSPGEYHPKMYLSETLPRFINIHPDSWTGATIVVPDDSVGYYAAIDPYYDYVISGRTGGGENYQGVVGAIGTTDEGDTVEYYLNKYGVLGGTIRSDMVRFNVVSPTKGIHNLKIANNYTLSSLTVANSVKVIDTLKVSGDPSTGSSVLDNVSFPDGLWWMRRVFTAVTGVYMVDWKNILPLPSGLYLFGDCFSSGDPFPGIDYNVDTLVIPDNCIYVWKIPYAPWIQADTIKLGKKTELFAAARANHFDFGQNLKWTDCSASGVTNVYPDSLETFTGTMYYGGTFYRDFSFGTGIRSVFLGTYFNNKVYFKNSTPPAFDAATTYDNVIFYVPSGSAESYFEATHGKSESFNPTIIEY